MVRWCGNRLNVLRIRYLLVHSIITVNLLLLKIGANFCIPFSVLIVEKIIVSDFIILLLYFIGDIFQSSLVSLTLSWIDCLNIGIRQTFRSLRPRMLLLIVVRLIVFYLNNRYLVFNCWFGFIIFLFIPILKIWIISVLIGITIISIIMIFICICFMHFSQISILTLQCFRLYHGSSILLLNLLYDLIYFT